MASTQFSIYIPRIFNNIPNTKIISTFENLDLGKVSNMDIVYKTGVDGSTYKMAFIHFSQWYYNSAALNFRERIENPELEARLVYDDPWYWIVLPNNSVDKNSADPKLRIPFEKAIGKYINLEECFNRINNMEEEISRVYEELFSREFIPTCKYKNEETFGDIETAIHPMSISELDVDYDASASPLHMPPRNCKVYPESSYYDEDMSISTDDAFYDLEQGGSDDSYSIIIPNQTFNRHWVTENMCGNA